MDYMDNVLGIFSGRDFSVPLWEVTLYVSFISFCMLFGRHRLGLLTTYCFVFYLGFFSNMSNFMDMLGHFTWGLPVYVFSGFMMFIVAIVGFFKAEED